MKVYHELSLQGFEAWAGATETQRVIIENNLETEFENLIDDCYPEGIDITQLNDILWFESEWIYENLGIEVEE